MIRTRPKEELLAMYDEIDEVNKILCLPKKYWTVEQRELVKNHCGGANGLTTKETPDTCEHNWVEHALLTSVVTACSKCGEKK